MHLSLAPTSLIHSAIPPRDLHELHALSTRNQERIQKLLHAFDVVKDAPTLALGYDRAAMIFGGPRGFSATTIRRFFLAYRKQGSDWRTLIDNALENKPCEQLPEAFLAEVQRRVDGQQRSVERALKSLRTDWTLGREIPGYGTWRDWWRLKFPHRSLPSSAPGHPKGWSTRNLRRKLDASKFRRIAQTEGLTAAKSHRPRMKHTRVGVKVGTIIQWDDVEHDFFVNDFQHKQAARPLELFAHDYASAYKTFYGMRTKIKDDQGYVKKLSGDMMRLVVAGHYYLHGYHPEGTRNIAEHGTACFNDDMMRALHEASGGLITLEESGFDGRAAHAGLYHGRPRGQPGHKASLESSNNLAHNATSHFPGQTGRNVERRPEGLHGMLTHNARLLLAHDWLPAEFKELLDFPLIEYGMAQRKLAEIYHQIATERDHELEGWRASNHIMQALEFNGHMMTEADIKALPAAQRDNALMLINAGLVQTKPVLKNRWEVWNEGRQQLIKITGGTVCKILGETFACERTVRSHQIHIQDRLSGPDGLWFWGHIITPAGVREELKDGQKYQCFLNPFFPSELFVRDAKGRFLGTAPAQPIASRGNPEASRDAALEYAKEENRLTSKLIGRQLPEISAKRNRHKNNAAVIGKALAAKAEQTRFASQVLDDGLPNDHDTDTADTTAHDTLTTAQDYDASDLW